MKEQPLKTDLVGEKTLKTDEKIEFFGQVDELSAVIMEFVHYVDDKKKEMELRKIVNILSVMMAETAGSKTHVGKLHLDELNQLIYDYKMMVGEFKGFVMPGETLMGAKAHVVRTVTRRAERAYAKVYEKYGGSLIIFEYLNKLSTLFFLFAREYDEKN